MLRRTRAVVIAALTLALALPASTGVSGAAEFLAFDEPAAALAVGDIAFEGLPALSASQAGSVNATTNRWDAYAVQLEAGQRLGVKLTSSSSADIDVYLFSPSATSTADFPIWLSENSVYPESFTYVASQTGTYFVAVRATDGSGAYTLSSLVEQAEADDDIPGVPLPASPVKGTLKRFGDQDDVFSVSIPEGKSFRFTLSGPATSDFDLFIYRAGNASSVFADPEEKSWQGTASNESGTFTSAVTDLYYIDVISAFGEGAYNLDYEVGLITVAKLSGPSAVNYGGTAKLTGSLKAKDGSPFADEPVKLQQKRYGWTQWKDSIATTTGPDGTFIFKTKPVMATDYRVVYDGDEDRMSAKSAAIKVKPKVSLSVPAAPTTVKRNVKFRIGGHLKPRHASGSHTVKVHAQRYERQKNGSYKWVTRKVFTTTNTGYTGYSRYRASISLPSAGRWRLVSVYGLTSKYAYTKSGFEYLRVK